MQHERWSLRQNQNQEVEPVIQASVVIQAGKGPAVDESVKTKQTEMIEPWPPESDAEDGGEMGNCQSSTSI